MNRDDEFFERRTRGNDAILRGAPRAIRRLFAIDHEVYEDGALPRRIKELLGLVASTVLRCDDCIAHLLRQAIECGVSLAGRDRQGTGHSVYRRRIDYYSTSSGGGQLPRQALRGVRQIG